MDKSSGNQDTGTKVLAEEEDIRGNLHPLDLLGNDRETGTEDGCEKDND